MPQIPKTVQPIHFEDLSGHQFERLVFAYLLRRYAWLEEPEWLGETGKDGGRDIWGVVDDDTLDGRPTCIACANYKSLTKRKVLEDVDKMNALQKKPQQMIIIAGGTVTATLRKETESLSQGLPFKVKLMSGKEFEEKLRLIGESLIKRFFEGEEFPDSAADMRAFIETSVLGDEEILALMATIFERPAFYTPFQHESCIPSFNKALTDTIEALSTGNHRTLDGTEIK